eukprot:COSAG05_NODE_365_length_10774_cov_121.347822_3_plen_386_part_00
MASKQETAAQELAAQGHLDKLRRMWDCPSCNARMPQALKPHHLRTCAEQQGARSNKRVVAERMAVRMNLNVSIVGGINMYSEHHQLQELQGRPVTSPTESLEVTAALESTGAVFKTGLRPVKQTGWSAGDRAQVRPRAFVADQGAGGELGRTTSYASAANWEACDVVGPGLSPTTIKIRRADGSSDDVSVTHMRTCPAGGPASPKTRRWIDKQKPRSLATVGEDDGPQEQEEAAGEESVLLERASAPARLTHEEDESDEEEDDDSATAKGRARSKSLYQNIMAQAIAGENAQFPRFRASTSWADTPLSFACATWPDILHLTVRDAEGGSYGTGVLDTAKEGLGLQVRNHPSPIIVYPYGISGECSNAECCKHLPLHLASQWRLLT